VINVGIAFNLLKNGTIFYRTLEVRDWLHIGTICIYGKVEMYRKHLSSRKKYGESDPLIWLRNNWHMRISVCLLLDDT
jgi:hypothetical protein